MRLYSVHTPADPAAGSIPGAGDDGLILVKEGFCWPAFFLSAMWAAYHRMWLVMTVLIGAQVAISAAVTLSGLDEWSAAVVSLAVAAIIGHGANDVRRWSLGRRGWCECDVVRGDDTESAEYRFVENSERMPAAIPVAAPAPPLPDVRP